MSLERIPDPAAYERAIPFARDNDACIMAADRSAVICWIWIGDVSAIGAATRLCAYRRAGATPDGRSRSASADPPSPASPGDRRSRSTQRSDTCLACHYRRGDSTSRHASLGRRRIRVRQPAMHGCESCHRPGQAHVGRRRERTHPQVRTSSHPPRSNQTCLTCHNRGATRRLEGSVHERRDLSCATCHSVHSPKSLTRQLVKATQTQLVRDLPSPAGRQDRARGARTCRCAKAS